MLSGSSISLSSLPIEKLDKGVSYLSRANKAISVALRLAGDSIKSNSSSLTAGTHFDFQLKDAKSRIS